jgi:hypothetical protein
MGLFKGRRRMDRGLGFAGREDGTSCGARSLLHVMKVNNLTNFLIEFG